MERHIFKIIIILILIFSFKQGFAQETNNTTETISADSMEVVKVKARGMIKELLELRILKDALKVRQFYDVQKNNTHNEPLKENIIEFRNETNISFSVKGEIDYDHFWVWICNNPTYRTPDGAIFDMLDAKYKVLFKPTWDVSQAPPKDNRLYTINVNSDLPESITNDLSITKFNETINKTFENNEIALKTSPNEFVNTGLFNGFDYLEGMISGEEVDLSKFSLILWGDKAIKNNSTFCFWEKIPKDINLLSYDENDLYKVDWVFGANTHNNTKYLEFTINNDLFGDKDIIDIAISRSSTTRNYKLKKLNINEKQIIVETLNSLTSLREEFEKLKTEIESHLTDNMESIILNMDSKYLTEGMSKLLIEPSSEFEDDFNKTLAKMYGIDALMQSEDDYSVLHAEIENILKDENKPEFINQVMSDLVFVEPTKAEDDILKNYATQLETITMKKLKERIKKEE